MNINSPDFVPVQEFKGCLEIQRQELSSLKGVKKNGLWLLWHTPPELLRQEGALDTGFILRRRFGVDEVSLRKGHTYWIVVSDLEHGRPISQEHSPLGLNSWIFL